jgi:hypothetical protein
MWMDPKHIVELWGPTGFTSTIHEMDVRAGGFRATVLFSEKDGKTTVVLFMVFQTSELRDREVKDHNAIEGAN